VSVYVLDRHQHPVPAGVTGELYIGGECLAQGYLGSPDLTAERFIPNPFQPGARLYRTGDLVRYRMGGTGSNLEFVGRKDVQIKLRGYRIEPQEIETLLLQLPAVREAAVALRSPNDENPCLIAYVATSLDSGALRGFLQSRLPPYMVPSVFVSLESLPRAINGKIDYQALPAPVPVRNGDDVVAPRNPVEVQIAQLWTGLLGLQQVGATDNFFDLGGHSLLATQLLSRVRTMFGFEIPLRIFFETPTVEGLAAALENLQTNPANMTLPTPPPIRRHIDRGSISTEIAQMSDAEVDKLLADILLEEGAQCAERKNYE
jgi:acyl carrier protein